MTVVWLATCAGLYFAAAPPEPWPALMPDDAQLPVSNEPASFRATFVNDSTVTPRVHAASAIVDPNGRLRCYWYGGTREGAADVKIYTSVFDPATYSWIDQRAVLDREQATAATGSYVRKLGNPVVYTRPDGQVWLFYVTVPVGGWAFSSINLAKSDDGGVTFGDHQRLITSPFLNRSMLVRSPALPYDDGTLALPVHFELHNKHSLILRLDDSGAVIGRQRLPDTGIPSLQPQLIVNHDLTLALVRNGTYEDEGRKVLAATSTDRGRSWSPLRETHLPNPNAAVTGIRTALGHVIVFNNSTDKRDQLSLGFAERPDGDWREIFLLEHPKPEGRKHQFRYSYPWLVRHDGDYHLFYTWNRQRIRHVVFNDAWLAGKIEASP